MLGNPKWLHIAETDIYYSPGNQTHDSRDRYAEDAVPTYLK